MATYQILVKNLDGTTLTLQFPTPTLTGLLLKSHLQRKTQIPSHLHRLATARHDIHDETVLVASSDSHLFPPAALLLRLRGGKGGFGSLLRGAATKAGQKKTSNFDACRDMSGRRLRHVNAEKRLEEWRAGAEGRRLEKSAEQFLRKKAKEARKKDDGAVEKYIEKYREDSERCRGQVDESVRQSFRLYEEKKRKALPLAGPGAKKVKLWLGKNAIDGSDSDSDEDDSEYEDEKSVVLDSENQKDGGECSGSGSQSEGEGLGGGSTQSNLDEGTDVFMEVGERSGSKDSNDDSDDSTEARVCEDATGKNMHISCSGKSNEELDVEVELEAAGMTDKEVVGELNVVSQEQAKAQLETANIYDDVGPKECSSDSSQENVERFPENPVIANEVNLAVKKLDTPVPASSTIIAKSGDSLNFDDFNSVLELQSLGMERLKSELQANGLKCGGTLQERAARLFLLKTTPLEKLPKKLLAKPAGGK